MAGSLRRSGSSPKSDTVDSLEPVSQLYGAAARASSTALKILAVLSSAFTGSFPFSLQTRKQIKMDELDLIQNISWNYTHCISLRKQTPFLPLGLRPTDEPEQTRFEPQREKSPGGVLDLSLGRGVPPGP